MIKFITFLTESFDNPIPLERDFHHENAVYAQVKAASDRGAPRKITAFQTKGFEPSMKFYKMEFPDHVEFHFNNASEQFSVGDLNLYTSSTVMRIFATILKMGQEHLAESDKRILLYCQSPKMFKLLLRGARAKLFTDKYDMTEEGPFTSFAGFSIQGGLVVRNKS